MENKVMIKEIHPIINGLSLTDNAKKYFSSLELYEIIEDTSVIDLLQDNTVNEAIENKWSFSLEYELNLFNKTDLQVFFTAIIKARSNYLKKKYPTHQMIFYTWYESVSGNFYFSLISNKDQPLPFGCNINIVESLDKILQEFIDDPYKGTIPLSECKLIKSGNMIIEEAFLPEKEYNLNVWATIIPF